jgi:hypothetical protein
MLVVSSLSFQLRPIGCYRFSVFVWAGRVAAFAHAGPLTSQLLNVVISAGLPAPKAHLRSVLNLCDIHVRFVQDLGN